VGDVGLFVVGGFVTLIVLTAAALVVWGIRQDALTRGRDTGMVGAETDDSAGS
jgi:hypothetical protein